jgi:hypothetical protein
MRLTTLLAVGTFALSAGCYVSSANEPAVLLGQQAMSGYHVAANANTSIPDGDIGFLVTANGQGGYALYWIDTVGSAAVFDGNVTTDVGFEPNSTVKYSGTEGVTFTSTRRIDFNGVPGASLQGMEFVSQTDPVYFDLRVNGSRSGFGIFFTGARTGLVQESVYDPVAFTSP